MKTNNNFPEQKFYNRFHKGALLPRRIITKNDFTYFDVVRQVMEMIDIHLGKKKPKVLDYGCGVGTLSLFLSKYVANIVGTDVSSKAIDIANASSNKFRISNVKFINLKEFKEQSNLDLIINIEVIEHVPNPKKTIQLFAKYLKRKGYLFLTTPSVNAPLYRWGFLSSFDAEVGHLRRYSEDELKKLLEDNGFKVIWSKEREGLIRNIFFTNKRLGILIKFFRGPLSIIVNKIDEFTVKIFGGSSIFILAQKQ